MDGQPRRSSSTAPNSGTMRSNWRHLRWEKPRGRSPRPSDAKSAKTAARCGISICGLHWLLARTKGFHLNHSDAAIRRKTSGYLCELVDFCADLGGKTLVLGSPQQRNLLPELSAQQAWDFAAETAGRTCPARGAAGRGHLFRASVAGGNQFHQHRRRCDLLCAASSTARR